MSTVGAESTTGVYYEFNPADNVPPPRPHGTFCTEECRELSRLCHLARRRRKPLPPDVVCPHCGAAAGRPCRAMTSDMRRLTRATRECHPSRLEAA